MKKGHGTVFARLLTLKTIKCRRIALTAEICFDMTVDYLQRIFERRGCKTFISCGLPSSHELLRRTEGVSLPHNSFLMHNLDKFLRTSPQDDAGFWCRNYIQDMVVQIFSISDI